MRLTSQGVWLRGRTESTPAGRAKRLIWIVSPTLKMPLSVVFGSCRIITMRFPQQPQ